MTKQKLIDEIANQELWIKSHKHQIEVCVITLAALNHKLDLANLQEAIDAKKVASESLPETTKPETDNNKAPSA
jgi:hypothetical protein